LYQEKSGNPVSRHGLQKEGCEWIKSELFYKKEKAKQKEREKNNPMKTCVLKFDHFENIHRSEAGYRCDDLKNIYMSRRKCLKMVF
jgi:hypothetical protein